MNIEGKFILDATCGGRTIWFNKKHPAVLYVDIRDEGPNLVPQRPNFQVKPDKIMDFRSLDLPDKSFKLVVWDPPHLASLGENSHMKMKYGALNAETWPYDLSKGFEECWRVLEDHGILIFKWNSREFPLKKLLQLFKQEPLFGHTTGSKSKTDWMCFMKIPNEK